MTVLRLELQHCKTRFTSSQLAYNSKKMILDKIFMILPGINKIHVKSNSLLSLVKKKMVVYRLSKAGEAEVIFVYTCFEKTAASI